LLVKSADSCDSPIDSSFLLTNTWLNYLIIMFILKQLRFAILFNQHNYAIFTGHTNCLMKLNIAKSCAMFIYKPPFDRYSAFRLTADARVWLLNEIFRHYNTYYYKNFVHWTLVKLKLKHKKQYMYGSTNTYTLIFN
jgi:hypothetical protein